MRKLVMGCAVAGLIALSPKSEARLPASLTTLPLSVRQARMEIGVASWYGEECHGNPTASGEIFDMNRLTAAHRELPLGTKVKVTNLRNKRTIVLRVNDRGPNIGQRIIDVSMVAAKLLGFLRAGLTPVEVEVISYPKGYADQQVRLGIPFQASNQN
jgi:rare lipoprotein A